jgi:hypothetical protein
VLAVPYFKLGDNSMSFKTTFRLFVSVCGLGAALYLVDTFSANGNANSSKTTRVFDLATAPVTGITIAQDSGTIECVQKGGDWFLNAPIRARGDSASIDRIVAMVESLQWSQRITAEQRNTRSLTLGDYGLSPAPASIVVDTADQRVTLFLGDSIPLGEGIYAKLGDSDEVLVLPASVLSTLPQSPTPLRNRSILQGSPGKTVRFEIQRRDFGFIQLVRKEQGWMLQQPLATRANAKVVNQLLQALYSLRVEQFYWDAQRTDSGSDVGVGGITEVAASARIESCGLAGDAARVRVTVWTEGDSLGQDLVLGKVDAENVGYRFAKRGEVEAIYTVKDSALELCECDVSVLRDRSLFPSSVTDIGQVVLGVGETKLILVRSRESEDAWSVTEPVQWPADRPTILEVIENCLALSVSDYLDTPTNSLSELGLLPPQLTISLNGSAVPVVGRESEEPEASVSEGPLLIGALRKDGATRFAKMEGRDEIFSIEMNPLQWLNADAVNPLGYRERTMLALGASSIRRISQITTTGEHGVERDNDGSWTCMGAEQQRLLPDALEHVLEAIARVRATQIVAHNPKSLDVYGLDVPRVTVTFGLQGEDGILKSILLGKADEKGQVFAMVRGQDVVFLIADTFAKRLSNPLCVPHASDADDSVVHSGDS